MSGSRTVEAVEAVAIVGMAGRFPGAGSIEAFWQNLRDGVESIDFFSDEELIAAGVDAELVEDPAYVKAGGVLDGVDLFDAGYFGFSPREAEAMDPQQRLFLECAVEALEHAGLDPNTFRGPIGVYAGVGVSTYLQLLEAHPEFVELVGGLQVLVGTNKDHLTTHVSYRLDLRGPSVVVQTACSTSLVAVCQAIQALLNYQCDAALAGGVSVAVPQREGYLYQEGGIESPDGHCRAFDARAQGTVGGNGVGIVVLKRLRDALADGDLIHAVIRGFAVNNDGAQKIGYTAPSIQGQAEVIAMAQAVGGIDADSITYVEAHGTGTSLGDPIEVAALTRPFRRSTRRTGFCAIGSVKSNIGHLDCAAGVASLIKTVLALEHGQIPPTLHFRSPNPKIDLAASPFYVNASLAQWPAGALPRRAGVSSFGIGGTNAHVVLEEAPALEPSGPSRAAELLVLSARTPSALDRARQQLADHLERHPELDFADVAFTLQAGRRQLEHRLALVARDPADAVTALRSSVGSREHTGAISRHDRPVVFLFPGQGSQSPRMARELYSAEPAFREAFDRCADLLCPLLGRDLRDVLGARDPQRAVAADELRDTWLAQPALFAVEYALAQVWMQWGVKPRAMLGHSVGEYTAACLAGVLTLEAALGLVAARGRLMQTIQPGAMLAVPLPAGELASLLTEAVEVAAVNAPRLTTVSGPPEAIEHLEGVLGHRGVQCRRLETSHAFHSRMMEPILEAFRRDVAQTDRHPPQRPYVSNVTGTWITAVEATDPDYYARQLREPVRFSEGVRLLLAEPETVFVEVGPGQALVTLVGQHLTPEAHAVVIPSLGRPTDTGSDVESLLQALGRAWVSGVAINWLELHARERRRKVALPAYPFERQRYWIEPGAGAADVAGGDVATDAGPRELSDWFYVPSWKRSGFRPAEAAALAEDGDASCWLILSDDGGLGERLLDRLVAAGRRVVSVVPGPSFARLSEGRYRLRLDHAEDYGALLDELRERGLGPDRIFHLWTLTRDPDHLAGAVGLDELQQRGFYSLVFLAQALIRHGLDRPVAVVVISNQTQRVIGDEPLVPEKTTVLGPCRTIPQEYPTITCRAVDVPLPDGGAWPERTILDLLGESTAPVGEAVVAYRGVHRWVQCFEPVRLDPVDAVPILRERGAYLITGGLGDIGLLVAGWLAEHAGARLALTGRTPFPERADWTAWLAAHDEEDVISQKIRFLEAIEEAGGEVLVLTADVTDEARMRAVVAEIQERFGALRGMIHCAGATGADLFAPLMEVTPAMAEEHFRPKVRGLLALDRVLPAEGLDFCVLMSSLSAVLGGLGFLPYAAANIFMDAFADARARDGKTRWISVNWDGWALDEPAEEEVDDVALSPEDGLEALDRILARGVGPQVVVSTHDLDQRLREWVELADARTDAPDDEEEGGALHSRPSLRSEFRAPRTAAEERIAQLWQRLLGVDRVGVDDNFFELGGHSLLALQLTARLRETFRVDVSAERVLAAPTVALLAAEVDRATEAAGRAQATIEQMLTRIEQMSDEQVRLLLAEKEATPEAPAGEA